MEADEQPAAGNSCPSSASDRKRPRDYGEVLKGLTPERGSDAEAPPSPKKPKTDHHEDEGEQSDGLDDGEIVEAHIPGPDSTMQDIVMPDSGQGTAMQDAVASHTAELQSFATDGLGQAEPADIFTIETSHKEGRSATDVPSQDASAGQPTIGEHEAGVHLAATAAFGKDTTTDKLTDGEQKALSQHEADIAEDKDSMDHGMSEPQSRTSAGWNQGVSLGVRTSFGKNALAKVCWNTMKRAWTLDTTKFDRIDYHSDPTLSDVTQDFWIPWMNNNMERLILALMQENKVDLETARSKKLLRSAIGVLASGSVKGDLKQSTEARKTAESATRRFSLKKLDRIVKKIRNARRAQGPQQSEPETSPKSPTSQSDDEAAPPSILVDPVNDGHRQYSTGDESANQLTQDPRDSAGDVEIIRNDDNQPQLTLQEESQRMLYFPGTEHFSTFCTHCVSTMHHSQDCPQFTCPFCGSRAHSRFGCPTKQRCAKCRQLGHSKEYCQEKLAVAREEMPPCIFCGAAHTEDECTEIWRSFDPSGVEIKKVKAIPTFCYTCGREGHYGPECGLATKGHRPSATGSKVWSQANRDLYVDPDSPNTAIAWVGVDMTSLHSQSSFHIRGNATKKTHIHYISSDDSDDDFIHAPVKKAEPRGGIKINAKTAKGSSHKRGSRGGVRHHEESSRRRAQSDFSPPPPPPRGQQSSGTWQPPLPTGPPPSLPTYEGSAAPLQHAPPGTLPPRPGVNPTPSFAHVPRGKKRNRGGRGRGRGK
ncbi:hypothetical protein BJ170DRAFT_179247 [Xylariales sp. AK1849]|nr:hypothetical protein BJ170DRAFT_179247 [Xylariales sp. AK1849]